MLGAGFGGLELTTRLSAELGDEVDVVLIDRTESFVFGFSKLDVMFGRTTAEAVRHPYRNIVKPGVRFVQASVTGIDPATRRVTTDAGDFEADVLVVALGAELDPAATPGLVEGGNEFYTEEGAFATREVLAGFGGGDCIVAVTSTPFKCPPAPSETALLLHEHLTTLGVRDRSTITLVMPMGVPIPPSPSTSKALLAAFADRDIRWVGDSQVRALEPDRKVAVLGDGSRAHLRRLPRRAEAPRPAGGGRRRPDRRRMGTRRPLHPRDLVPRRVRRRRRDERRHAQGRGLRRGPGRRGGGRDRDEAPRG